MDKYEYKIRAEEIKTLIGRKKYTEAMEIADSIDWRKVKSVNMLCTVSDLYKINRRYEESREILLLAYERHPGGRMIIYSLCELSIKLDDVVRAVEYYKEFVQTAPRDNGRYVLQYKLYEAQEVTLEERIAVLEELKSREYREKWAYELAYLYHRIGLSTKCVEECDELILWFGEGKYVLKAMELKMLHAPLSQEQQKKYKKIKGVPAPSAPIPQKIEDDELDIEVKPVNVGEYATINLQKELAESMKEVLGEKDSSEDIQPTIEYTAIGSDLGTDEIRNYMMETDTDEIEAYEEDPGIYEESPGMYQQDPVYGQDAGMYQQGPAYGQDAGMYQQDPYGQDAGMYQQDPYGQDAGIYQQDPYGQDTGIYEQEADVYEQDPAVYQQDAVYEQNPDMYRQEQEAHDQNAPVYYQPEAYGQNIVTYQPEPEEVYMEGPGDFTREILTNLFENTEEEETETSEEQKEEVPDAEEVYFEDTDTMEIPSVEEMPEESKIYEQNSIPFPEPGEMQEIQESSSEAVPSAESMARETNSEYDNILSQEYNGQIRFVMPAKDVAEKQITGQISINDVLLEWEKMKKENEEKRAEAVRQRVKEQTGEIFSQFDASTKEGILAELDVMAEDSIEKEKSGAAKEEKKSAAEKLPVEEEEAAGQTEEQLQQTQEKKEEEGAEEPEKKEEESEEKKPEKKESQVEKPEKEESSATANTVKKEEKPEKETAKGKKEGEEERQEKPQRAMTAEEKKLFGSFIQTRSTKNQILDTLDKISLASYTGNVILTGEPGMGSIKLAKNIIKEIQMTDSNFSGKMAKITGQALNHKDMQKTFDKLIGGALIVEGAGELKEAAVNSMAKLLEQEKQGIIVILEDTKINMNKLLDNYSILHRNFNLRIDVEALDNDSLVLFAKKYAFEKEYVIDELGVLALYTRISEMQTSEHSVTMKEVKEIVDEAIYHAGKKNMGHFMDILLGKRYDSDDMIILREKDFV